MNAHRYENLQTRGKIGVTAVMLLCNEDAATPPLRERAAGLPAPGDPSNRTALPGNENYLRKPLMTKRYNSY